MGDGADPIDLKTSGDAMQLVRRTDAPPLRFKGRRVFEAFRLGPDHALSSGVRIFRGVRKPIVIEIALARPNAEIRRAQSFKNLESALYYLERYDPSEDAEALMSSAEPIDEDAAQSAPATVALARAADLQTLDALGRDFQDVVTEAIAFLTTDAASV